MQFFLAGPLALPSKICFHVGAFSDACRNLLNWAVILFSVGRITASFEGRSENILRRLRIFQISGGACRLPAGFTVARNRMFQRKPGAKSNGREEE
ncbi:hypothetical protein [Rhizobium ruizarguesonis]|uniref:hypothetical protein n=1 Tax=Rhizobium ruizarguesonis TaxID=2081791 RepID=UPI0013EED341|nr:hypothetical protein [Rhizobium ruizarguesonis]